MGIFLLSPEFRLFDGPRGHSRDSSKYRENVFMCIYNAVHSSRDHVRHFYPDSDCPELARRRNV